jgi:hypothetical protein
MENKECVSFERQNSNHSDISQPYIAQTQINDSTILQQIEQKIQQQVLIIKVSIKLWPQH